MNSNEKKELERLEHKKREEAAAVFATKAVVDDLMMELDCAKKKLETTKLHFTKAKDQVDSFIEDCERARAEAQKRRILDVSYCPVYGVNDLYDIGRRLVRGALTFEEAQVLILDRIGPRSQQRPNELLTYKGDIVSEMTRPVSLDGLLENPGYYDVSKDMIVSLAPNMHNVVPVNHPHQDQYYLKMFDESMFNADWPKWEKLLRPTAL